MLMSCCHATSSGTTAVRGRLVYDDEDKLKDGVWVRWDFDHLVFYQDNTYAKDYTAYVRFLYLGPFI